MFTTFWHNWHTSYFVYLRVCLRLGLFMFYLLDLFFFTFVIITINHSTINQLLFLDMFVKSSFSECCFAFAECFANLSLVLPIKLLLIKELPFPLKSSENRNVFNLTGNKRKLICLNSLDLLKIRREVWQRTLSNDFFYDLSGNCNLLKQNR